MHDRRSGVLEDADHTRLEDLQAADVASALAERDRRIAELEAQVALLRTIGGQ